MFKKLYFEWIISVIEGCINDKEEEENILESSNVCDFTVEESREWMEIFKELVCKHRDLDKNYENAKGVIKGAYYNLHKSIEEIADLFLLLIIQFYQKDEKVKVYRNGQVYKEIISKNVDLIDPPKGLQIVHFSQVLVNQVNNRKEVYIQMKKWQFRMNWENVPDKYKVMYCAWLKFQNIEIPEDLVEYGSESISLADLWIEFNLDKAERVN